MTSNRACLGVSRKLMTSPHTSRPIKTRSLGAGPPLLSSTAGCCLPYSPFHLPSLPPSNRLLPVFLCSSPRSTPPLLINSLAQLAIDWLMRAFDLCWYSAADAQTDLLLGMVQKIRNALSAFQKSPQKVSGSTKLSFQGDRFQSCHH